MDGSGSSGGATLDDPILNGPYAEPDRHWAFDDHGITSEVVARRRPSAYFVPVPAARGAALESGQAELDISWTQDRLRENDLVNEIRRLMTKWRHTGRRGLTTTSHRLLEHWTREGRDRQLFYAQLEAVETTMWLLEVAPKDAPHIVNRVKAENATFNSGLTRVGAKLATGAGKTMVMALLICWHACNKHSNSRSRLFSDSFLVVAPGITIRDRLRVLLPSDPDNYYRAMDLIPPDLRPGLDQAKVVVTNFHTFALRESRGADAGKLTKQILADGGPSPFVETPDQMVRRICRAFGTSKRGIVVLNDEAHHCWQRPVDDRPAGDAEERLSRDEQREAAAEAKDAHLWLGGLKAIDRKIGIRAVYDLSATPFFLKGSGYGEGTLFPWVVTDFSLIDAIEAGLVKIPRLPVDDNAGGEQVVYRELWSKIGSQLPKTSRAAGARGEGGLPDALAQALQSLYDNYVKAYQRWEDSGAASGPTPPVFIVVCQNTAISKMVYDHIAGWARDVPGHDEPVVQAGELELFRNDDGRGDWLGRPRSILVDSKQIESGEAMTPEFKRLAGREIDEFKQDLRQRFPGRNADDLTDEDLLREVLNTVGKAGRLGEHVRCVVSVSMLTEGWDVNTVTHILGVRAFGTQLLCEQVVGRGLRRRSYAVDPDSGKFTPEYAEVYGVPFSFIRTTGKTVDTPTRPTVRVQALEARKQLTISFPNVAGYRYEITDPRLGWDFDNTSTLRLDTRDLPTEAQISGVVGESEIHTLDEWRGVRDQTVAYKIAERVLAKLRTPDGDDRPWLFPQVIGIVKHWLREHLELHDDTFAGLLLTAARRDEAAERVYRAIARAPGAEQARRLLPTLRQGNPAGTTDAVDFDTIRPVYTTDPALSHISHVALHSSWEQTAAQAIEATHGVASYCKNDHLGFHIPYTYDGAPHYYEPDFLISLDVTDGEPPATLIVEISGDKEPAKKAAKCSTARDLWCTSVNNDARYGQWYFTEITDVIHIRRTLRAAVTDALTAHTAAGTTPARQKDS